MSKLDRRPSDLEMSDLDASGTVSAESRNRRGFIQSSAVAATGLILGAGTLAQAKVTARKPGITAEATKARRGGGGAGMPQLYAGQNSRNFNEILFDESQHVPAVIAAIQGLGGTPRPKPTFQNLQQTSLFNFIVNSWVFENTGAQVNQYVAPFLTPATLTEAAQIAFVEAYHTGFLNALINQPLVPGHLAFSPALPATDAAARVMPYIASLNGGPGPLDGVSTTPSTANDIAILNFALILEYLENEFYSLNVPHFYPVA